MYKRPTIRKPPYKPSSSPPPVVSPLPPWLSLRDTAVFVKKPYVPIWQPPETVPEPIPEKEVPFPVHVHALVERSNPHRPSLKQMLDALRLDGASEERLKKCRNFYANLNRTAEKRDKEFEKCFGQVQKQKPVKKTLKVVKKR